MSVSRRALVAGAAAWVCALAAPAVRAVERAGQPVDFAGETVSPDVRFAAQWIVDSRDHKGLAFAIVDKLSARLYVFDKRARLIGATPVLLGVARGDHLAPGVGKLPVSRIPLADRTTPAGRFASEPGTNLSGEDVVWMDYSSGLAIHRVRADASRQTRLQRLASGQPARQRVSAGCVVVPVAFYDAVVQHTLGRQHGVVYVLPETRSVREMFAARAADT